MVFRLYWKQAGDRQNMIIRQLNIKNSGEIHDKTLEFSPGINVLYGENESERAIVHTYIKNMYLGDISEAIYDNAVFAAKLKSPTEQDLARELQKFMTGYQGTADSSMDLGRAMQMLKMSRKGRHIVSCCLNFLHIKGNQKLAFLYVISILYMRCKIFSIQFHCIDPDMDQKLHTTFRT